MRALRRTYTYFFKLLSEAAATWRFLQEMELFQGHFMFGHGQSMAGCTRAQDQEMVTVKVASSSGMVWLLGLRNRSKGP